MNAGTCHCINFAAAPQADMNFVPLSSAVVASPAGLFCASLNGDIQQYCRAFAPFSAHQKHLHPYLPVCSILYDIHHPLFLMYILRMYANSSSSIALVRRSYSLAVLYHHPLFSTLILVHGIQPEKPSSRHRLLLVELIFVLFLPTERYSSLPTFGWTMPLLFHSRDDSYS